MREALTWLRIVVLQFESDLWCDVCNEYAAVAIVYVTESADIWSLAVHRLSWCEFCAER